MPSENVSRTTSFVPGGKPVRVFRLASATFRAEMYAKPLVVASGRTHSNASVLAGATHREEMEAKLPCLYHFRSRGAPFRVLIP